MQEYIIKNYLQDVRKGNVASQNRITDYLNN